MNQKTRKQRRNTIRRRRNNKRRQRKTRTRRVGGTLPPRPSKNQPPPKNFSIRVGNRPPYFVPPIGNENATTRKPLNLNNVFGPPSSAPSSTNQKNMIYTLSEGERRRHQQEQLKEIERIENRLNEIKYGVMRGFNMFNGSAIEDTTDPMQYFEPTISKNHFEGLGYTHKPVIYSNPKLR